MAKNEEEERKRAVEEAAKKEEEERKRKEEAEIKKRQEESLRLTGSKKYQQTTDPIDTQGEHDHTDQGHGEDNPDSQEPAATSGGTREQTVFSGMNLIPFM